jgi:leader peptidase (prepilin peptidase)/N-methyltransferase
VTVFELIFLPPVGWIFAAVWGALWGSFFNVAVFRIGLYESVVSPPSRCVSCGAPVTFYDNIPILSWLLLRGRCRRCGSEISLRYPLVEAASTLLALAVYWRFLDADALTLASHFLVYFAFLGTLLVLSLIDLDHLLIPDRITLPATPIFLILGVLLRDVAPLDLVIGAVIGYGGVLLLVEISVVFLKREGMGMGDAKLLMLIGALLGWRGVVWAFFVAPFPALLVTVPLRIIQRKQVFRVEVPYGPFLALAAAGYVFFGQALLSLLP